MLPILAISYVSPLLLTAILIIAGTLGGALAKRLKLPALTGQIFIGILLGSSCFNLLGHSEEKIMSPITQFAIGLIAMTVGTHLNFRRLHNSYKRILIIAFSESLLAFSLVFFTFEYFNPFHFSEYSTAIHLLIASIACATSPASALHIIKEKKAKGLLVKTMIGIIAVDNLICLLIFEICRSFAKQKFSGGNIFLIILQGALGFIITILIGITIGFVLKFYSHWLHSCYPKKQSKHKLNTFLFSATLVAIAFTYGICTHLNEVFRQIEYNLSLSPLMASLILGLILANTTRHKDRLLEQFDIIEQAVFSIFFVIAGLHLNLNLLNGMVISAIIIYLTTMILGKYLGAYFGAILSASTEKIRKHIGKTLFIQAGISIALIIVLVEEPSFQKIKFIDEIAATLLTCVIITEFIGSIFISRILDITKETGKDKTRLIDFLDEEFILSNLYAHDRFQAIEDLCHFMVKTHRLNFDSKELTNIVIKREKQISTALGDGVAVPHGRIESNIDKILGVLAIAEPPLNFDAIDGQAVSILILIITPKNHEKKYLEVLSSISKIMQKNDIRKAIINAKCSGEIYEIIHSEELEYLNYFTN